MAVNAEAENLDSIRTKLARFLATLPREHDGCVRADKRPPLTTVRAGEVAVAASAADRANMFLGLPIDVNYTASVLPGVAYTDPLHAVYQVLGHVLSNAFLHREIREKGGAYGGGMSAAGGLVSFYSYRDPNVEPTLHHYDSALRWARQGKFSDEVRFLLVHASLTRLEHPRGQAQRLLTP